MAEGETQVIPVDAEVFKTENVQNTNELGGVGARVGGGVDTVDQPGERTAVQGLCLSADVSIDNNNTSHIP